MIRWLKFSKIIYILNEFTSLKWLKNDVLSFLYPFLLLSSMLLLKMNVLLSTIYHPFSALYSQLFPFYFLLFLNLQTLSSFPVLNSQPTNCKQHQENSSLVLSSPWVANLQDTLQGRILFCSPLRLRAFALAVSVTWNALHLVLHVAVWVL